MNSLCRRNNWEANTVAFCDMLGYLLEKKRGDQHELEREKVFGDEYDHNEL